MLNIEKRQLTKNYSIGRVINPSYIIVHETDDTDAGANADALFRYWNRDDNAQASVHFCVDSNNIIQYLELNQRAWHVGDNKGYSSITNDNTIGIEMCVNSDGDYDKTWYNTVELVRYLMKVTGIPASNVKRHYDASGKWCPRITLDHGWWPNFQAYLFDLSKPIPGSSSSSVPQQPPSQSNSGFSLRTQWLQILCNQLQVKDQNNNNLVEDGFMGPCTRYAIQHLPLLTVGSHGPAVTHIQNLLGVSNDGIFGQVTKDAVSQWQCAHELTADGIIGPNTWLTFA